MSLFAGLSNLLSFELDYQNFCFVFDELLFYPFEDINGFPEVDQEHLGLSFVNDGLETISQDISKQHIGRYLDPNLLTGGSLLLEDDVERGQVHPREVDEVDDRLGL